MNEASSYAYYTVSPCKYADINPHQYLAQVYSPSYIIPPPFQRHTVANIDGPSAYIGQSVGFAAMVTRDCHCVIHFLENSIRPLNIWSQKIQ
jgi:hypothetical protein